jgi:hypothetical protein
MGKFDWKEVVKTIAPTLGKVVSIANPMAGLALSTLSEVLLGKLDGTEEDISLALKVATPEQLLLLKQADNQFKLDMEKLELDFSNLDQQDRSGARDMASKTSLYPQIALSVFYIGGYFGLLFLFVTGGVQVPDTLKTEFNMLLGMLSAPMLNILNFWFGSSKSSHDKNQLLGNR